MWKATIAATLSLLTEQGFERQDQIGADATAANRPRQARLDCAFATGPDAPLAIVLEKREWDDKAVTAARVTAMQEFCDLFSSEVLAPGRQVAVESVTLFFSDLSNSTALYTNTSATLRLTGESGGISSF